MQNTPVASWSRRMHHWIGLYLGAVLALIGVTGSINVYEGEIDRWLYSDLMRIEPKGKMIALDEIVVQAQRSQPAGSEIVMVKYPYFKEDPFTVVIKAAGSSESVKDVMIDPYSGRLLGERPYWKSFSALNWDLHQDLLLGFWGGWIVAAFAFLLFTLGVTGFVRWWPANGRYRSAMTIRHNQSSAAKLFQLHRVAGIYVMLPLMIAAISGFQLAQPKLFASFLNLFSIYEPYEAPVLSKDAGAGQTLLSTGAVHDIAMRRFPKAVIDVVIMPEAKDRAYLVSMRQPGEPGRDWGDTLLWIHPYSGSLVQVRDPYQFQPANTFVQWLQKLHSGDAFRTPGRIFIFILGFVPLLLFLTGLYVWKRKPKPKKRTSP